MTFFVTQCARKATNITLDPDRLEQARSLKINTPQASEQGLSRAVAAKQTAM